ncbi:hypothetical protein [Parapedobacter sp. 10938]|uniref:hypothetical protein n=1 Tax=Parapedobacter flavus TaxID=3110225 RepID=UPI002DBA735C|nr:hypothetical protein [Parapedobacter sp. 10938]MEC3878476.1 hypothetical protein [Parapedobacter sp. 10938]
MRIEIIGTLLVSILVATACKKSKELLTPEPQDNLLVKRIVTVLQEREVTDPFTSKEELVFAYDDSNRLITMSNKTIHQFTDRTETMERGHTDFIYDQEGKPIRRDYYGVQDVLGWYDELAYGDHDLPTEVSSYSLEWDPIAEKRFFQLSRYDQYAYNTQGRLVERITHQRVRTGNELPMMTPVLRALVDYDEEGNIRSTTVYPLVEMYGTPGKPSAMEEYRYGAGSHAPLYFGLAHSPFYGSGSGIYFAYSATPVIRQKTTSYHEPQGFDPTYGTRDFTIDVGKHGYPETIREVYVRDAYLRPSGVEAPVLVSERGIRVSTIEYISKR